MRKIPALKTVLFLLCCASVRAEIEPAVVVNIPQPVGLTMGESCRADIRFHIAPGFHIQANPASEKFLIAAELKVGSTTGVQAVKVIYPSGKPYRLKGINKPLSVYGGDFSVGLILTAHPSAKPGASELKGSFRFQACDEKTCLFPDKISVIVPVQVSKASKAPPENKKNPKPCVSAAAIKRDSDDP
ncbi:MAG: hypothetical protein HYT79_04635 [Elusimicrobia bacterium]|nr:hypothetical protein [Elusimicrobiota bacterium]